AGGVTHVDFIARNRLAGGEVAGNVAQLLAALEHRLELEQAQSSAAARRAFHTLPVVDRLAEHLHAAAKTDDFSAIAQVANKRLVPSLSAQEVEVGAYVLAAGQQHEIGRRQRLPGADQAHLD